ncbi:MAG: glycosyltransferase family 4 protein [Myxococcota bacterium]
MARAFTTRGHEVDILAPAPDPRDDRPEQKPDDPGISLHQIPYMLPRSMSRTFYRNGVLDNLAEDARSWPGLTTYPCALLRRAHRCVPQWDSIVSHWMLPSAIVGGLIRAQLPHLAIVHSADLHLLKHLPLRRHLARFLAHRASCLSFVASSQHDEFAELLGSRRNVFRTLVAPMGIDPRPDPDLVEPEQSSDRFRIGFLGRLVEVKGVDVLIRAVALLKAAHPELSLEVKIAGDGDQCKALQRLARALHITARFTGHLQGKEKERFFQNSDLFCAPSRVLSSGRTEGVPVAVLEAMAHGLPIVASSVGGISDVVRSPWGTCIPPGNPSKLARAIRHMMHHRNQLRSWGRMAYAAAKEHFWPNRIQTFEQALQPEAQT